MHFTILLLCAQASSVLGILCGQTPIPPNLNGFIVGGTEARPHSIPWQVMMTYNGRVPWCGASIVSSTDVITAAHCVKNGIRHGVWAGLHLVHQPDHYVQKIEADVIVHPKYDGNAHHGYDIAVMKLKKPLQFTEAVQPICLPKANTQYTKETMFLVSGWGKTSEGGKKSEELRQLVMPNIPDPECTRHLRWGGHGVTLCAGYLQGGKDSCQGDSGGPAASRRDGKWTLDGVVSYGPGCARAGEYGMYSKVSSMMDWVLANVDLTGIEGSG